MPTILFEGGHFVDDYTRKGTRKYYTVALYYALKAIRIEFRYYRLGNLS
jgi:hypothetical protein